ncbi:MAG: fibronectin type III domain-containing protein [Myxococcota bacterium]
MRCVVLAFAFGFGALQGCGDDDDVSSTNETDTPETPEVPGTPQPPELPPLPSPVIGPVPTDAATNVSSTLAVLSWAADSNADEFDVYFGLSALGVANASESSPEFLLSTAEPSAALTPLVPNTTYYWRVDARNEAGTTRSPVFSFTLGSIDAPPVFSGLETASALDDTAVRLTWSEAIDGVDSPASLEYLVFASSNANTQEFAMPVATVTRASEITVTSAEVPDLAAGAELFFVVRARDRSGNTDHNEVELPVLIPSAGQLLFVDALASAGGNGAVATPFQTIQAAVEAVSADGATIAIAAGVYNEQVSFTATGNTAIRLLGGFPAIVGQSSLASLLAARDPVATPTVVSGTGLTLSGDQGVVHVENGGRLIELNGLTLDNAPGFNTATFSVPLFADDIALAPPRLGSLLSLVDGNVRVLSSTLTDSIDGETPTAAILSTSTAPGSALSVIASRISDLPIGVAVTGSYRALTFTGNRVEETTYRIIDTESDFLTAFAGTATLSVPEGAILNVRIADNAHTMNAQGAVLRTSAANQAVASNLDVLIARNQVTGHVNTPGISSASNGDAFGLETLGWLGMGGTSTVAILDNRIRSVAGDIVDVTITELVDPDAEFTDLIDVSSNVSILVRGNEWIHGNSEGVEVDFTSVAPAGTLSIVMEQNHLVAFESAGLNLNVEQDDTEADEGEGGAIDIVFRENTCINTDGPLEVQIPAPVNGSFRLEVVDNMAPFSHEEIVNVEEVDSRSDDPFDDDLPVSPLLSRRPSSTAGADIDIVIARNYVESEDQGIEVDLPPFGGTTRVVVQDNETIALDEEGINFSLQRNLFFDDPGSATIVVFNNLLNGTDDGGLQMEGFDAEASPEPWEVNMLVVNNEMVGNQELASIGVVVPSNGLFGVLRNYAGLNDVDSSGGIEVGTAPSVGLSAFGWVKNNVVGFAAGSGIETLRAWPELINNTVAFSGNGTVTDFGVQDVYPDEGPVRMVDYAFSPLFVSNTVVFGNDNGELEGPIDPDFVADDPLAGSVIHASYSLGGSTLPGFNNIVGDPNFVGDPDVTNFRSFFALNPVSPVFDAGNPAPLFNDPDGTRNDIGAFGGPAASTLGYLGPDAPLPLVAIGLRPLVELASGRRLVDGGTPLRVIFSDDVDASTVTSETVRFSVDGFTLLGAFVTTQNEVEFTPTTAIAAGSLVTLNVNGVASVSGTPLDSPMVQTFAVAPASVAEVEDNDTTGVAQALASAVNSVTGDVDPDVIPSDARDVFSFSATAGQRLSATVFHTRDLMAADTADFTLTVLDTDGTTVLTSGEDHFGFATQSDLFNFDDTRLDPLVDFVFTADGTYYVVVENEGTGLATYELQTVLR